MGRARGHLHLGARVGQRRSGPPRAWTDQRIERELRVLVKRVGRWPTHRDFRALAPIGLEAAMHKYGGPPRWAPLLGVDETRQRHRADGELEAQLRSFLGDRQDWPTIDEFVASGQQRLIHAVGRTGGASHWAKKLSKSFLYERDRSPYSTAQAVADARAVIATEGVLPGANKLAEMGRGRLAGAVKRAGGAARFRATHRI